MTESEAVKIMEEISLSGDNEAAHGAADQLLLDFLDEHGFRSLAGAYRRCRDQVEFWYA